MKKAAVLWTGGKDCAFALMDSIGKYNIVKLITFVPENHEEFFAHSIEVMKAQAYSIGLPHELIEVKEPFKEGYVAAMHQIKKSNIEVLITGDISTVDGHPNWITECASGIIDVDMPLWELERKSLMKRIDEDQFKVVCSLSYKKYFEETITGRMLNPAFVAELLQMENEGKIDACGENGEYHTMVLSAPYFKYDLIIMEAEMFEEDTFNYLRIRNIDSSVKRSSPIEIS
ncbi:Dph6-related ATP pyrophosphatase [Labilibacter marinus]|uniref:Dph6-related ATP pyrophosphatase n=1 Tax=Labilibacter marinus TaxID=1477105 RepID=UPI00082E5C57|nr:hypothetical protein [Labilibacter marinus]